MEESPLFNAEDIVRAVWPDADPRNVRVEKVSHRRNADHWRVRHGDESVVVRRTTREESARRIIAALTALEGESFAPSLRASVRGDNGTFLIAMEDLGDMAPTAADTQAMLPEFVAIIKALHRNDAFRHAVDDIGRSDGEDSSMAWAEHEWATLQELAPTDTRLGPARAWLEVARANARHGGEARQAMVHGHGDTHNANWRLTEHGPALIDWEEIRCWPLASELADFIVFGRVDAAEVTRLYGAPDSYTPCVQREAAACALSFYLYWLRTLLDGSDPRPASLEAVRVACERLFSR